MFAFQSKNERIIQFFFKCRVETMLVIQLLLGTRSMTFICYRVALSIQSQSPSLVCFGFYLASDCSRVLSSLLQVMVLLSTFLKCLRSSRRMRIRALPTLGIVSSFQIVPTWSLTCIRCVRVQGGSSSNVLCLHVLVPMLIAS